MSSKRPSNIDRHISRQIRKRREDLQLTQPDLADRAGVSFQQFQKYENGENRVPAGRLFEIARALRANIAYFYPGGEGNDAVALKGVAEEASEFQGPDDNAAAQLVSAFNAIESPARRKAIVAAVQKEAAPKRKRKRR